MLHPGCAVQDVSGYGKGIVALQHIRKGEIIVEEEPLLAVDDDELLPQVM